MSGRYNEDGTCKVCGQRLCAYFAFTNAATLRDWRETHLPRD